MSHQIFESIFDMITLFGVERNTLN